MLSRTIFFPEEDGHLVLYTSAIDVEFYDRNIALFTRQSVKRLIMIVRAVVLVCLCSERNLSVRLISGFFLNLLSSGRIKSKQSLYSVLFVLSLGILQF